MSRTNFAARILDSLKPQSILDIGCREAALSDKFPGADYFGADLLPDTRGRVKYVGDVTELTPNRTFDVVTALDILEHLERPSDLFDRLVEVSERAVLVSLPNSYDLKSRLQFSFKAQLGGKYVFLENPPQDRHRWLMNRHEIVEFYKAKAAKHDLTLQIFDMTYGASQNRTLTAVFGRLLSQLLSRPLITATVFGLFLKMPRHQGDRVH